IVLFFFYQAEDGIRDPLVTGVQTCALPISLALAAPTMRPNATSPDPRVHTFSIVARDQATGQMGVAVQSHYFSVGPVVPWAEAEIGRASCRERGCMWVGWVVWEEARLGSVW